jgi:membrane fusion protein, copper/silver efflux system
MLHYGELMNKSALRIILALGIGVGAAGAWSMQVWHWPPHPYFATLAAAAERHVLYFRDPGGAPSWSATPKKDAQGRDYLPVYNDEEPSFEPPAPKPQTADGSRTILYYRNPMGLPDTSPVPKRSDGDELCPRL